MCVAVCKIVTRVHMGYVRFGHQVSRDLVFSKIEERLGQSSVDSLGQKPAKQLKCHAVSSHPAADRLPKLLSLP